MRYDFIHIIAITLLCSVVFSSCRAKKDLQRNEETNSRSERVERFVDTTRVTAVEEQRTDKRGSEVERQYTRTTEYDTTGRVQAVSETWRDRRLSNVSSEERDARTVSVAGMSVDIIERDTSTTIISEVVKVDTDSRLIQGAEWFWIILSLILIATVIIYIIYNRIK